MHHSMTGFAAGQGSKGPHSWSWDLRSVNAKGLDIRIRVPDWLTGLEAQLKSRLTEAVARGNVTLGLRITREDSHGGLALNTHVLDQVMNALTAVEETAMQRGVSLAPSTPTDILAMRGVLETAVEEDDVEALTATLLADFAPVLDSFLAMRAGEGRALCDLLLGHLDRIEVLVGEATALLDTRRADMQAALHAALARVKEAEIQADEQRLAQELALIAVKADVTEELDRLTAHVAAGRALLQDDGPAGRKLDFLSQEFNREANTLCSKSQHKGLTAIGLELKAVIEQMREQVQNLE